MGCGGGKRTNYRKELMHQSNGGKACFGTAWETEDCNTNPCLKYVKIQLQTLCSAKGLDAIKTESECKAAANELVVAYGNAWNGAQDFPDCIFADDARQRVYFNTHATGDTTLKNCKNMHKGCHKYAAICKDANDAISNCDATNPKYIGCFSDDGNRDLEKGPMKYGYNQKTCNEACKTYKYFALQNNGWCVCGDAYATEAQYVQKNDGECYSGHSGSPNGNSNGGAWRNSVYHTHVQWNF